MFERAGYLTMDDDDYKKLENLEEFTERVRRVFRMAPTDVVKRQMEFAEGSLAGWNEGNIRAEVCREILKERGEL